jgi:hypothetical protein
VAALQNIREGDIVLVDKKGRRSYCIVRGKVGRELQIEPLVRAVHFTYRTAIGHEVIEHWRKTKTAVRHRTRNDN